MRARRGAAEDGIGIMLKLSYIDDGLWGFEVTDAEEYVIAFFRTRNEQADRAGPEGYRLTGD